MTPQEQKLIDRELTKIKELAVDVLTDVKAGKKDEPLAAQVFFIRVGSDEGKVQSKGFPGSVYQLPIGIEPNKMKWAMLICAFINLFRPQAYILVSEVVVKKVWEDTFTKEEIEQIKTDAVLPNREVEYEEKQDALAFIEGIEGTERSTLIPFTITEEGGVIMLDQSAIEHDSKEDHGILVNFWQKAEEMKKYPALNTYFIEKARRSFLKVSHNAAAGLSNPSIN